MTRLALSILVLCAGCASVPDERSIAGSWGGTHVGMQVTAAGGTLDYDCANGTIHGFSIMPDGTFSAVGTHTPAAGGPERVGEVRPVFRARYSGSISGSRMTLRGRLENGVELGPFTLRRGAEPILMRCL